MSLVEDVAGMIHPGCAKCLRILRNSGNLAKEFKTMTEALEFADNVLKPMRLAYAANTQNKSLTPEGASLKELLKRLDGIVEEATLKLEAHTEAQSGGLLSTIKSMIFSGSTSAELKRLEAKLDRTVPLVLTAFNQIKDKDEDISKLLTQPWAKQVWVDSVGSTTYKLPWSDFKKVLEKRLSGPTKEQLRAVFDRADTDGSGTVDLSELKVMLLGFGMDAKAADRTIEEAGIGPGHEIPFEQFLTLADCSGGDTSRSVSSLKRRLCRSGTASVSIEDWEEYTRDGQAQDAAGHALANAKTLTLPEADEEESSDDTSHPAKKQRTARKSHGDATSAADAASGTPQYLLEVLGDDQTETKERIFCPDTSGGDSGELLVGRKHQPDLFLKMDKAQYMSRTHFALRYKHASTTAAGICAAGGAAEADCSEDSSAETGERAGIYVRNVSSNGTYLNDSLLEGSRLLAHGDQVQIKNKAQADMFRFRFIVSKGK